MNDENKIFVGNFTTIINTLLLAISGLIIGMFTAYGIKLPVDEYGLSAILGLILFTLFGYINAKYHNTYFDKDGDYLEIEVTGLSPEQIKAIQQFIDQATTKNIREEILDIDPSLEYENDDGGV